MTARVLVVEDEPALARGLADHFRDEGYDVRVVGRGDQVVGHERNLAAAVRTIDHVSGDGQPGHVAAQPFHDFQSFPH